VHGAHLRPQKKLLLASALQLLVRDLVEDILRCEGDVKMDSHDLVPLFVAHTPTPLKFQGLANNKTIAY
jgi:hypothetical protein